MNPALLDRSDVRQVLFHPRRDTSVAPPSAVDVSFPVEPSVLVGGRLYPADVHAPAILLFHGNGEIAADYDDIAPFYARLGLTLAVADYRGYGASNGTPSAHALLADAVAVLDRLAGVMAGLGLAPARIYLMGRSLGSAAAIEAALQAQDRLAGLIVESGFADTIGLLARIGARLPRAVLTVATESADGFDNAAKIERIHIPTLIIHGQNDILIPPDDAHELYRYSGAAAKRLVIIPGAGHNDLLWFGATDYFQAIRDLSAAHQ